MKWVWRILAATLIAALCALPLWQCIQDRLVLHGVAVVVIGALLVLLLFVQRKCPRCGRPFVRLLTRGDVCPRCEPEGLSCAGRAVALAALLGALAVAAAGGAWALGLLGVPLVAAIALGAPAGAAAFAALMMLLNRDLRRAVPALGRGALRQIPALDLAAARRAAGCPGRTVQTERLSVWTDAADDVDRLLVEAAAGAADYVSRLAGRPVGEGLRLRLLCFEREAAFAAYTRGVYWRAGRWAGYCGGLLRRKIVLCRELSEWLPSTLEHIAAHEVTHALTRLLLRRLPPPWLSEGLATLVASWVSPLRHEPAAGLRAWRAAEARGELLDGDRLVAVSYQELAAQVLNWDDPEAAAAVATVYTQGAALVAFLFERDRAAFARFLAAIAGRRHPERRLQAHFGMSPEEATAACIEKTLAEPVPAYEAPPDDIAERIEAELVPLLIDREAEAPDRRLAIRSMSRTGYPWRADALIAVLDDPDESLRIEARRALENMAGKLLCPDPAAWRDWLYGLPDSAVAIARDPAYHRERLPQARIVEPGAPPRDGGARGAADSP